MWSGSKNLQFIPFWAKGLSLKIQAILINLMNSFREKFKGVDFGLKNEPFAPILF